MKHKKKALGMLLIMLTSAITRTHAQSSEIKTMFGDLEARSTGGTPGPMDEAEPVLERLALASRESIAGDLPVILQATNDPRVFVRRIAASALYQITTRPDGQALLAAETPTFSALLVDQDIPIRRISMLAVATLRPRASSPIMPSLGTYLARQDAVSTIGAAVATVLLQAAPNNADTTNAVVQYMRRKDQTSVSRNDLLNAITFVAKSHSREIGKEVAAYADDPDEQTSVLAIGTLQHMGTSMVLDNQEAISRIAADPSRAPSVRAAATKALSAVP